MTRPTIPIFIGESIPDNIRKFLLLISHTEGTDKYSRPYNVLFGGKYFEGYEVHPNVRVKFGKNNWSTAAGRYQILNRTAKSLNMPDFTPASQDNAAIALIKRRGAYNDIIAGEFETAINKCNREWASLPNSPYGQPTETMINAINFLNSIKE